MKPAAVLALAAAACASMPSPTEAPRSLAAAETAFAAHSVREDMRAAFIAHFAPDGVFVRDGCIVAREGLEPRAAPPIVLDWRPVYVEVASSGEMGLSTGPWRLTARGRPEVPASHGQFVSIWRRGPRGAWKVAADLGISNAGDVLWSAPLVAHVSPGVAAGGSVDEAEEAFRQAFASDGARGAYTRFGAADLRFYREGRIPFTTRAATLAADAFDAAGSTWRVETAETARSGDFGYARGSVAAPGGAVAGYWLRAWRREPAGWRIVLDVVQPGPRKPAG